MIEEKIILVTMHRRENQGEPIHRVFKTLRLMVDNHPEIEVVYPVHLSPSVQAVAKEVLGDHDRIHLIAPLDVFDFHNLASEVILLCRIQVAFRRSSLTGKPVLVLRDTTERQKVLKLGH